MKQRRYIAGVAMGAVLIFLVPFIFYATSPRATSPRGGGRAFWSEPVVIVDGSGNYDPFAFQDSSGVIHLFWSSNLAGDYDIYERTYDGEAWSEARRLTTSPGNEKQPVALEEREGRIRLFFSSDSGGKFMIYEMTSDAGEWSTPAQIPHKLPDYWNSTTDLCTPGFTHPSAFKDKDGNVYLFFCSFMGATENLNELFVMMNDGTRWSDQVLVGENGYDPSAFKDSEGTVHVYVTDCAMIGGLPSMAEWTQSAASWTRKSIATSIPNDPWVNRYTSAFQCSDRSVCLFYSGVVWNASWDEVWQRDERIYEQVKTPSRDWNEPVEITGGIMPSALKSQEGSIYLFFIKDGTIYLTKSWQAA